MMFFARDARALALHRGLRPRKPRRSASWEVPITSAPRYELHAQTRDHLDFGERDRTGSRRTMIPYVDRPPPRSRFSKTVTAWPRRASSPAQERPAGPAPMTATLRPVGGAALKDVDMPARNVIHGIALEPADPDRFLLRS